MSAQARRDANAYGIISNTYSQLNTEKGVSCILEIG